MIIFNNLWKFTMFNGTIHYFYGQAITTLGIPWIDLEGSMSPDVFQRFLCVWNYRSPNSYHYANIIRQSKKKKDDVEHCGTGYGSQMLTFSIEVNVQYYAIMSALLIGKIVIPMPVHRLLGIIYEYHLHRGMMPCAHLNIPWIDWRGKQ